MDADAGPAVDLYAERRKRMAECLDRAMAGDLSALNPVVEELNPLLWHIARSEGLTAEDAADVVQTTWLELVRQLHRIRSPLALTAWLIKATKREAWRTDARRRKHPVVDVSVLESSPDQTSELDAGLTAKERHRVLWRHIARLTEQCQALLRAVARADRPDYASIAEALGMPHGSIGPTRGRCLAKLRAMLTADPEWSAE